LAFLGVLAVAFSGCFHPNLGDQPFKCGINDECPPDYTCVDTFCRKGGTTPGPDAPAPKPDAPPGTPDPRPHPHAPPGTPDAAPSCGKAAPPPGPDPPAPKPDAPPGTPDARPQPDAPPGTPDAPLCAPGFVGCQDQHSAVFCVGGQPKPQHCDFACDPVQKLC